MSCLPKHHNCVMSAREAPVLLGRICSLWRAISLATPRLWASIHIADPGATQSSWATSHLEQRLEVTRTWLQRSGECPLSISLHSSLHSPGTDLFLLQVDTPSRTPAVLQMLILFASRWQHIHFDIPAGFVKTLGQLTASDVPMLKTLALNQINAYEPSDFTWARLAVLSGSCLTSISILGNGVFLQDLPVRWTQLTSLSTFARDFPMPSQTSISSETALWAIAQCPNLRSFSFDFHKDAEMSSRPMVEHRLLQMVECRGDLSASCLFGRLSLPALKELRFTFLQRTNLDPYDDQPFVRFLSSSLRLESLHLGCDQAPPSSLQNIVCSLPPTVKRLYFSGSSTWNGPSIDDDVLAAFTPVAGLATPCPVLQVLRIDRCTEVSDAALLRFITARAATLKRIQIDFARTMELDIRPQLKSVIPGLDISVTHLVPDRQFSPWQGLPNAPLPLSVPLTVVPLY
ncbi:hypothetical protein DFH07DRAFT_839655 [Mycena maculata]|uniref:F-box domain-containing protein n=1 Tax=Mycena maculata TaxID=230809 RepID=A0AAD7MZL0_9AGAR|nr:hypothetical protein DFH07DRAFT_839655 [Mycena maculata]